MSDVQFIDLQQAVVKQLEKMQDSVIFQVDLDYMQLWELYLETIPPEHNPIHETNRVYDCNADRNFIRDIGSLVTVKNGVLTSVWDCELGDDNFFKPVIKEMSEFVKQHNIKHIFYTDKLKYGHKVLNFFDNLYFNFKKTNYAGVSNPKKLIGKSKTNYNVLGRTLGELFIDSINTVLELINDNAIYNAKQFEKTVKDFKQLVIRYNETSIYRSCVWELLPDNSQYAGFKNTAIGSLVWDINNGEDIETAVKKYESKVAPHNYKRPSSIVTKKMIENAQKQVEELGMTQSLERRFANLADITVNNLIWASPSTHKKINTDVFDDLLAETPIKVSDAKFDNAQYIDIENFIENVVPNAKSIQVYVENQHQVNFVSLVSPVHKDSPNMLKWNNNFTWSYDGNLTDSDIKRRVKIAGGDIHADVRVSLSWFNTDDLDLHIDIPYPYETICYSNKRTSFGYLDVDMNVHGNRTDAVENIAFPLVSSMPSGTYTVKVHNYTHRDSHDTGFDIEVEVKGTVHKFSSEVSPNDSKYIECFKFDVDNGNVIINLDGKSQSQKYWNINTESLVNVSSLMYSPNHWDNNNTGNKHYFIMLDNCLNPNDCRGFYNEFLSDKLKDHRKVFEVLGSKLKAKHTTEQLSGIGFSETIKKEIKFVVDHKSYIVRIGQ